jgi:hypothetical protein
MVKNKTAKIDGSEAFHFDSFGLTKSSIRRKGDYILIPVELQTYLKLCILPLSRRIENADSVYRWRKNHPNNGSKSTRRGGAK